MKEFKVVDDIKIIQASRVLEGGSEIEISEWDNFLLAAKENGIKTIFYWGTQKRYYFPLNGSLITYDESPERKVPAETIYPSDPLGDLVKDLTEKKDK